ncbi:MAG: hypothetical protein AAF734_07460 [Bacteroidota bacterium]
MKTLTEVDFSQGSIAFIALDKQALYLIDDHEALAQYKEALYFKKQFSLFECLPM